MIDSGDETPIEENAGLPIEMQYEEVDMNDPKMDPLEWAVRKTIPIPRKYYWQTGNQNLPMKTKAWHNTIYALGKATRFTEAVGGVVANFIGLNQSRYDYVTSSMTEEEWEEARQIAEMHKKRREERRKDIELKKDESGALNDAGISPLAI